MRKFLGMVAGIVVTMLTIAVVERAGHAVYPAPPGADMSEPAAVAAYIASAPLGASLFVVAGWFLGVTIGGWVALKLTGWPPASWIVAGLTAIFGIINATMIPAPLWMQLSTVLAPALGGLAAHALPGWKRR